MKYFLEIRIFCVMIKKNPGIELLSHTHMCSTIVVRPLIDRVRDGNVSFKPAVDTGKKIYKEEGRRVGKRGMMQIRLCVRVICITDKS